MVLYLWILAAAAANAVLFHRADRRARHAALQRFRSRRGHVRRMRKVRERRERLEKTLA